METYQNNNYLKEYIQKFKELLEKISNKFNNLFKNEEKHQINQAPKNLIKEIIDATDRISDLIRHQHIIIEEYCDFIDIYRLIWNVLTNEEKFTQKNLSIITKIIKEFKKITELKFNLIKKYSDENEISFKNFPKNLKEEFKEKYEEFRTFLFDCQLEYYAQGTYDGEISQYSKLLEDKFMEQIQ